MDLHRMSLSQLSGLLSKKEISARECVTYYAQRIDRLNPSLNAFTALDIEAALDSADHVDERRAHGDYLGRIAGIPFAVKDLEDLAGFVTTRGSALFRDSEKVTSNSHMAGLFIDEGAIALGKTNTPEFGWKSDTTNATFGPTRNPYDLSRSPGGSSGGSAVAIAAGLVAFATGSDGGGSIRIPASACGLSAMKTSLGRIPSISAMPGGWSDLSVPGPMARTVRDTALLLDIVVGDDGRDFRSHPRKPEHWFQELALAKRPGRIAFSLDLGYSTIDPEVSETITESIATLEADGLEVEYVDSLFPEDPLEDFFRLTCAYYAKTLGPWLGHPRYPEVDEGIRDQITKGLALSASDFLRASDTSFHLNRRLYRLFQEFDLLIAPTTAGLPPFVGKSPQIGGIDGPDWVRLTYPFNMARSPAASVFAGMSKSGMPVGLQIIGPHLGDLRVLRAAAYFEGLFGKSEPLL